MMSREVRMVPKDWQHPKRDDGTYKPLREGPWKKAHDEWVAGFIAWQTKPDSDCTYSEYNGGEPSSEDYMPDFAPGTATHYMMYATTSEGIPISPAFDTPEKLARWLADTGASAFARMTATYEEWLAMIGTGSSIASMTIEVGTGRVESGVATAARLAKGKP